MVKTLKSETSLDLSCNYKPTLIDDVKLSKVMAVEHMLQIQSSDQINETLTNEELQIAAEMFLYLTVCPDTIKPWIVFYRDLFQTQSPDQIILTLNRLKIDPKSVHFTKITKPLSKADKLVRVDCKM